MADETESIHHQEEPHGEKKDNPYVVPPQADREEKAQAADATLTSEQEAYNLDLTRAKLGVERFKADYIAGDDEWTHLLTEAELGEGLQAMYLGIKPMCSTEGMPHEDVQILIQNSGTISIPDFEMCIGERGQSLAVDVNHVASVIAAYPQYFPDYTPEKSITTYMMRYTVPFQERTTPRELEQRQFGLLYGFPPNAVDQFVRHGNEAYQLTVDLYTAEDLSPVDEAVLLGLNGGSYEHPDSMEEFHNRVNHYTEAHQEEIRTLLDRRYPNMNEETKHYILTARFVDLPGLGYTSSNPTPEDKAFEQRIRNIFEDSGMNAYLASLKSGNMA